MYSRNARPQHPKTAALILAILLGVVIAAEAFSLTIKQTLLNSDFHKKIIEEQLVIGQINADLPELFMNIEQSSGFAGSLVNLPGELIGKLLGLVIPPDWVAGQVEGVIQNAIDFVESDQQSFTLSIDLATIKGDLQKKSDQLVNSIIGGMPACTGKQLLAYAGSLLTSNTQYPYCMPPKPFDTLVKNAVANSFNYMRTNLPETLPLVTISLDNPVMQPLAGALRFVRFTSHVYKIAPYLIIGLILTLFLIESKNLRIAIRAVGIAFFGAGVVIFLISLGMSFYGKNPSLLGSEAISNIPLNPGVLSSYLSGVFIGMQTMLVKLALGLGLGGLVITFATVNRQKRANAPTSISTV